MAQLSLGPGRLKVGLLVTISLALGITLVAIFALRAVASGGASRASEHAADLVEITRTRTAFREKHAAALDFLVTDSRADLDRMIAARHDTIRSLAALRASERPEERELLTRIDSLEREHQARTVDVFGLKKQGGVARDIVIQGFDGGVAQQAAAAEGAMEEYVRYKQGLHDSAAFESKGALMRAALLLLVIAGSALVIAIALSFVLPRFYARLYERERSSRSAAETAETRMSMVARAGSILASSLSCESTLETVARLVVPGTADWCVFCLPESALPSGRMHVAYHADAARTATVEELARCAVAPASPFGAPKVLATAEPDLLPSVSDDLLRAMSSAPRFVELARAAGMDSLLVVPLVANGRVFGTFSMATGAGRTHLHEADVWFAEELARRASAAIENARLYDEAQRAVRTRDELLETVSHDLKNPLASILLHVPVILRLLDPEAAVRRHVVGIQRAAERMNRMIRSLLDAATIDSGDLRLERHEQSVAELLAGAAELVEPAAAEKGIELVAEPAGEAAVWCDRDRILQVFANLLENAVRMTPRGGRVRLEAQLAGTDVVFAVSDTGPGVGEPERSRLFERRWHGRKSAGGGTGLGLFISRGIILAHGGRIWVESEPGAGATFRFSLERCRGAAGRAAPTNAAIVH